MFVARTSNFWSADADNVTNAVYFYSSKDEVVANGNDGVKELLSRDYAWYNQERKKGSLYVSFNPQAGWRFNNHYLKAELVGFENGEPQYNYRKYTPEETMSIADTNLMVRPFFGDFKNSQIYGSEGSDYVLLNDNVRWYALSHGIPAESFAVGANPVPKWGPVAQGRIIGNDSYANGILRNVDMARNCVPEGRTELPWIHSYFIQNSLFDTMVLYEAIVEKTGSTKATSQQEGR